MSRQGNLEPGESALEVIREEQSPAFSAIDMGPPNPYRGLPYRCCKGCKCMETKKPSMDLDDVEQIMNEKEKQLTRDFDGRLNKELDRLRERAEYILQNEQVRASYMLREAHRERQEKISALQTQLQCKNLAGLMYVMCSERNKSKIEKLAIIEEYTNYILALQDILAEAQTLILNLSRGYKSAARVDQEWREKMKKTLLEFQMFVHDYAKGTPESDQYFFDLPKLLETKEPIKPNPYEDPCECEEDELSESTESDVNDESKPWYERVDEASRPFIVFGDMADFKPPQRRDVLHAQKALKTAPAKWKKYVFHDMFVSAECANANRIKDLHRDYSAPSQWEAQPQLSMQGSPQSPQQSAASACRRLTRGSADARGGMGSILKIITSSAASQQAKSTLLGARDSMEIASTTKLREKHKYTESNKVVLKVGSRRTSLFEDQIDDDDDESTSPEPEPSRHKKESKVEEDYVESSSTLGSTHNDSLTKVLTHRPDRDHKINYEKVCPSAKCGRMHASSFVRALPAYMRGSPFTLFEQTFDEYEACSPEQLEILRERIEKKKNKERIDFAKPEINPLDEWTKDGKVEEDTKQPSESISVLECACKGPNPSPAESNGHIFDVRDLCPMKEALNQINRECFYDSRIQFDRFKVIGYESSDTIKEAKARELSKKNNRLEEVTKVLKQHPSLLDIFQANAV